MVMPIDVNRPAEQLGGTKHTEVAVTARSLAVDEVSSGTYAAANWQVGTLLLTPPQVELPLAGEFSASLDEISRRVQSGLANGTLQPSVSDIISLLVVASVEAIKAMAKNGALSARLNELLAMNTADNRKSSASWGITADVVGAAFGAGFGLRSASLAKQGANKFVEAASQADANASSILHAEGMRLQSSGHVYTAISQGQSFSQLFRIGESSSEAQQIIDQNHVQTAQSVVDLTADEMSRLKQLFSELLSLMKAILENIEGARDSAASVRV